MNSDGDIIVATGTGVDHAAAWAVQRQYDELCREAAMRRQLGIAAVVAASGVASAFGPGYVTCVNGHRFPPEKPKRVRDRAARVKKITNRRQPARRG